MTQSTYEATYVCHPDIVVILDNTTVKNGDPIVDLHDKHVANVSVTVHSN
jgi:hypothetical protein